MHTITANKLFNLPIYLHIICHIACLFEQFTAQRSNKSQSTIVTRSHATFTVCCVAVWLKSGRMFYVLLYVCQYQLYSLQFTKTYLFAVMCCVDVLHVLDLSALSWRPFLSRCTQLYRPLVRVLVCYEGCSLRSRKNVWSMITKMSRGWLVTAIHLILFCSSVCSVGLMYHSLSSRCTHGYHIILPRWSLYVQ